MGVRIAWIALVLAAAGIGVYLLTRTRPQPIEILGTGRLPQGATLLELKDSPTYRTQWNFGLEVRSNADRGVTLAVRFEAPVPPQMSVKLVGEKSLLPRGSARPTLVIRPPHVVGRFKGRITLYSKDLPHWSYSYDVRGNVIDKPREGGWMVLEPTGIQLGSVRPGEPKPFRTTIRNEGTRAITIREWRYDRSRFRLPRLAGGERIAPGGALEVHGTVKVPERAGAWRAALHILSDAANGGRRDFFLGGNTVPDHVTEPARLSLGNVYPARQREIQIVVRASPGVAPFRVTRAFDLAPFFELRSLGSDQAATAQTVRLRVRKEAPPQRVANYRIRFRLEPPGTEVMLPVTMWLRPSIFAQPQRLVFGRVERGQAREIAVQLSTFAGRSFRIRQARSKRGFFVVRVDQRAHLAPRVLVALPEGIGTGRYTDKIIIETDDADTPTVELEAYVEIG